MFRQQFPISKHNIYNSLQYFLQFKCECNISSLFFNSFRTYKCVQNMRYSLDLFQTVLYWSKAKRVSDMCPLFAFKTKHLFIYYLKCIWLSDIDFWAGIWPCITDIKLQMLLNEPLVNGVQEQCHMATWTLSAVILWFICDHYWQTNGKHLI